MNHLLQYNPDQSSFLPINPPLFNPKKQIRATPAALTKMVQKAARKPSINATLWSLLLECSVTDAAMAAVTANPTELPNCDTSLNTPPANDCVSTGNASEMTMLDTVKRTTGLASAHYSLSDRSREHTIRVHWRKKQGPERGIPVIFTNLDGCHEGWRNHGDQSRYHSKSLHLDA